MTLHERVGRVGSQRLTVFSGYVTMTSLYVFILLIFRISMLTLLNCQYSEFI
jgi:hypothetical protein